MSSYLAHGPCRDLTQEFWPRDSLLMGLLYNRNYRTALVLIANGVDVTRRNDNKETALHRLFPNHDGDLALVREVLVALVRHGADINATDAWDQTALTVATMYNVVEGVTLLLECGADPNYCVNELKRPVYVAVDQADAGMLVILLDHGATIPSTLLHFCAKRDRVNMIDVLLERGVQVDTRDDNELTPLMMACRAHNIACVKLLLKCGADTCVVDKDGNSPLQHAVDDSAIPAEPEEPFYHDIVKLLLQCGAHRTVNWVFDRNKGTPLFWAVRFTRGKKDIRVVKALLRAGANPNIGARTLYNTLMQSVRNHNGDVTRWLLQYGCTPGPCVHRNTYMCSAVAHWNNDALRVLIAADAVGLTCAREGEPWFHQHRQHLRAHGMGAMHPLSTLAMRRVVAAGQIDRVPVWLKESTFWDGRQE